MIECLHQAFIEGSERFYVNEAHALSESYAVPEYLVHVDARLNEEAARARMYLCGQTDRALMRVVEQQLIYAVSSKIVDKGYAQYCIASRLSCSICLCVNSRTRINCMFGHSIFYLVI